MFQGCPFLAFEKDENPESQLAKDDRIDGNLRLLGAEPLHYARVGRRSGGLAQNVGIHQVLNSLSVDSERIGVK